MPKPLFPEYASGLPPLRLPGHATAPYGHGGRTSYAAAVSVEKKLNKLQRLVLNMIASKGNAGATDEEGIDELKIQANTYHPRRRELAVNGYVEDSGRTRKTRSGRAAIVWVATTKGVG